MTTDPQTMEELIRQLGPVVRIRWWLFKRMSDVGWAVCPEPMKSQLRIVWRVKMGDFKQAVADLEKEHEGAKSTP